MSLVDPKREQRDRKENHRKVNVYNILQNHENVKCALAICYKINIVKNKNTINMRVYIR